MIYLVKLAVRLFTLSSRCQMNTAGAASGSGSGHGGGSQAGSGGNGRGHRAATVPGTATRPTTTKGKNFTQAEVDRLLDLVEESLPTGIDEWTCKLLINCLHGNFKFQTFVKLSL